MASKSRIRAVLGGLLLLSSLALACPGSEVDPGTTAAAAAAAGDPDRRAAPPSGMGGAPRGRGPSHGEAPEGPADPRVLAKPASLPASRSVGPTVPPPAPLPEAAPGVAVDLPDHREPPRHPADGPRGRSDAAPLVLRI